ncbi:cyclic nucleotide-binding-like protein [Obelidium mucronatum]|nr:cyclic nucleotide-binding-like protein [Obelidium mucronatum]
MALIIFFAAMVCYIHFHACFIFFMSREANFEDAAWIPIQPQKMSFTEKYAQGVWMAMANTFFVTFKFWRPDTVPAQWCETFFCVFEAIFSASITGMISAISVGEQSPAGKFVQRLDQVKEYIRSQKIDKTNLGLRAQHGFTLKYQGKIFNEEQILGELNPWLRQEILLHGCEHILKEVPFFQRNLDDGRNELLLRMIAEILDRKSFAPGECICEQGDSGDEMFFLLEGTVSIKVHGEQIGLLNEGSYFGELSMFADILRPATLTAVTSCQCRALRRHHLLEILQDFPDISDKLIEYYQTRMAIILNSMQAE